jgi:hypothetical protein
LLACVDCRWSTKPTRRIFKVPISSSLPRIANRLDYRIDIGLMMYAHQTMIQLLPMQPVIQ